jgi:hypothetical protein
MVLSILCDQWGVTPPPLHCPRCALAARPTFPTGLPRPHPPSSTPHGPTSSHPRRPLHPHPPCWLRLSPPSRLSWSLRRSASVPHPSPGNKSMLWALPRPLRCPPLSAFSSAMALCHPRWPLSINTRVSKLGLNTCGL